MNEFFLTQTWAQVEPGAEWVPVARSVSDRDEVEELRESFGRVDHVSGGAILNIIRPVTAEELQRSQLPR